MRKEIEKELLELQILTKETRRKNARNIPIVVILAITFFLIPYFYPELNMLWGVFLLIMIFGGSIFLGSITILYQPLKAEFYAFKKITRAIQILEKSKEPIAYEEAYRCVKHAHKILKKIELDELKWYEKINQTIKQFLENLQLIVLPAIRNSNIKIEHLEEFALAVLSINPSEIEAMNERLESESSYKKVKPPPRKIEILTKRLREYTFVFTLTIGCCIFYYMVVNYLGISTEYALTASVAIFLGLLAIYFKK